MKIKILIIAVLCSFSCFAQQPFKTGDIVNVWAVDGLQLYQQPAMVSDKTYLAPYGATVTITDVNVPANATTLTFKINNTQKSLALQSKWVKIKYENKEAYALAGGLSKMPCFKKTGNGFETEDTYLQRIFGKPAVGTRTGGSGKSKYTDTKKVYNGGYVTQESQNDGCINTTVQFPKGTTYQDAVLFEQVTLFDADAAYHIKIFGQQLGRPSLTYYSCD